MGSGLPDIKYNFLIGGSGSDVLVYEGQGWNYLSPNSSKTIQVALIGNFERKPPPLEICDKVRDFIELVVREKDWKFCDLQIDDGLNTEECSMNPTICIQPKKT